MERKRVLRFFFAPHTTEILTLFVFILIQKQDPDSKLHLLRRDEKRATYRVFLKFRHGSVFFWVVALFSFFFSTTVAYAGILDSVRNLFAAPALPKNILTIPANSQTMALLEAVKNTDPSPDTEDANLVIIKDSAILAVSTPDQSGENKTAGNIPTNDQISVYVVRKGDTLSAIAKMFGVSANTILWANNIPKGGGVQIGQKLVILPTSGVQYVVKKGDTIAKIAALYKADADEILGTNNLDNDSSLVVGDTIIIPNGIESETPSTNPIKNTVKKVLRALANDSSPSTNTDTDGYFIRPTAGKKTQGIHGHNGIDFHASRGTVIVAAAAGTVVISRNDGWNGGYGQYIVIKHQNGTQTLYAHLSVNAVNEGQEVSQGQLVGYSGDTGKSFGPHLHFEVRGGRNPF
jgi:murein DD-endopeptidase MepM/ murein hydrolase activator NlpD